MLDYEDDFFFEEDKIETTQDTPRECGNEELLIQLTGSSECIMNDLRNQRYQLCFQNLMGMTVTSGNVTILKDDSNLIGISIGGGAPLCPCLYIVQIFDNTPAFRDGTLQSGDELVGVNGQTVKGKTKVEVAKMIQSAEDKVNINYNKLHADPRQGNTLDIVMKKVKHRLIENMSQTTADALGLSRAILCNDTLVKKLRELQKTEQMYHGLVEHAKRMLKAYFDLLQTYKLFGDVFASVGVREPQPRASEAFTKFGEYHRQLEKDGIKMIKTLKPILADIGTYLHKAIPDTKLTIKKYADTKFEYLSYCLKVKEMDDEEYSYGALQEPLYRVETGNYEYRLILRCRQEARNKFAKLRSDVLVKMELLDSKHVQDVVTHLHKFISGLAIYHNETQGHLKDNIKLFPIEVDLAQDAFKYKSSGVTDTTEDEEVAKEVTEDYNTKDNHLLPELDIITTPDNDNITENTNLLAELGLDNIQISQDDTSTKSSHSFFNLQSKQCDDDDGFTEFLSFTNQHLQKSPLENENLLAEFQ